jgi:hypothetical protein
MVYLDTKNGVALVDSFMSVLFSFVESRSVDHQLAICLENIFRLEHIVLLENHVTFKSSRFANQIIYDVKIHPSLPS